MKKIAVLFLAIAFISCITNKKEKQNSQTVNQTEADSTTSFNKIIQKIPLKSTPIIDSTNFNNIITTKQLNIEEIKQLQLNKIYPTIEKEKKMFQIYPSYKLNLGDFNSIVLNVYKGEHELETILIIYDSNNNLSQFYNKNDKLTSNFLVIAYDEIAEGWSTKYSEIKNNIITIIDVFYGNAKQIDTTKFHINKFGDINKIKTDFKSKLRPKEDILLNKIYTDTIEFKTFNDNGDYSFLEGKKGETDVYLIYNWEWYKNEKYNFKKGDFIEVKWKMDSIWIAGDGETLDFSERAVDAQKINYKPISLKR